MKETRIVQSPEPEVIREITRIISVELKPDEDVEWIWTYYPDIRVVIGYRIIPKG